MVIPASAAGTPTLSISSGEVKAGESVTLTVSIEDNPGIAATLVYVYYDESVFSADPDEDVEIKGAYKSTGSVVANTIDNMKGSTYDGAVGKDGIAVLWFTLSGKDVSKDGDFFAIKLKADKKAANGDYTIGVGVSSANTCNAKEEDVTLKTSSGKLTVTGGSGEKKPASDDEAVAEFTDISGHWAENYIRQSAELGLVEGYQGLYRPNDTMTRAEFVTILWRAMGEPEPSKKASFTDLTQEWYLDAVAWAEENSVVNGMGDGLFAPNGSVTREQLVTILHRLAGNPMGMELMLSGIYDDQYSDSGQIGDWAKASLYWSIYEGIYCGENAEEIGSTLAPKSAANRAQIAVMMIRYLKERQ